MLVNEPSLEDLEAIYALMKLPEPLMHCHVEDGVIVGLIDGWIHADRGIAAVEHMVVLPYAPHKFRTMMQMSKDCVAALHAHGLDIVLKIYAADARSGLRAWAKRLKFVPYHEDHEAVWYIRRKEEPADGRQE